MNQINSGLTDMGAKLSKLTLETFEFFNEIIIAAGAGLVGIGVLIFNGLQSDYFVLTIVVVSLAVVALYYAFQITCKATPSKNKIIFITGCDSGLGFSVAQHASDLGFRVLAGCLNLDSAGSQALEESYGEDIKRVHVDITNLETINKAIDVILDIIEEDPENNVLWAVVNNAGIMSFAEFEWQTPEMIQNQITTNFLGTCLVAKAFCPLLRKYEARLINVTSHCAKATLPGLSVYGATKSAITSWSDALRMELQKYNVKVITFVPGSFTAQSLIMANHVEQVYEMQTHFTPEQKLVYTDYFKRYNAYLNCLSLPEVVHKIEDKNLYSVFDHIILDCPPKFEYINEPLRYCIYHKIFKYSPVCVRDRAVQYFMGMPVHEPGKCPPSDIGI